MKTIMINNKVVAGKKADPGMFMLVSNDVYSKNLNAIIAYHQISKGETSKRFVGTGSGMGNGYSAS